MMRVRLSILGLALLPTIAFGQSVRGVVSDASTATPLPGVVVTLLDHAGTTVGRALSNEQGEYRVIAPGAGTYRLRALRIGFSPVTSGPLSLVPGGDVVHQLALTGIPYSLDTVRIASQGSCEVRPDSARQTYRLWEQARAALTATQLTERAGAIRARIVNYERALEPQRERVVRQNVRVESGVTRTPFRAVPLDSLRRAGYVVDGVDGTTSYYAPDMSVLLSDDFAGAHCMRVVTDRDPTRIGIAFEPTRERRRIPEIEGTLWLDRRTSELRIMEFRYVNITRDQAAGRAGGELRFVRMNNGAWVISGWTIRMPVIQTEMRRRFGGGFDPVVSVRELRVEGGDLALATRGSDTLWARPPMNMQGVVTDSTSGLMIADALVTVRGTGRSTRTDSAGRFVVTDMIPGEYTLDIATPTLERLSMSYPVPFTFIDSRTTVSAKLPPAGLLTRRVCPDTASGVLSGAVLPRDTGATLGNARVTAEWSDRSDTSGTPRTRWLEAQPDRRGRYVLCGLPLLMALDVRADGDSGSAAPLRLTIDPERRIVGADFRLDLATRDATLYGAVLSAVNGQPLPDVEILIPALNRNTFTNAQGAFRLRGIPPGAHEMTARRVGYTAVTQTVTLVSSQSLERQIVLSTVPTLEAVTVQASITMRTFEEHRALGLGHFLTRVELDAFQGRSLQTILAQAPRASVALGSGNYAAILSRRVMPTGREISGERDGSLPEGYYCPGRGLPCACYAQVYVDGHLMNRGDPTPEYNINEWSADRVEAIEWYSGRSDMPVKYLSNQRVNCGVLVIHTRRYEPKKEP